MDGRLDSWKEIAAYLGRGVTTVQRWEHDEGLPVHRLAHAKKGSVFAFRHELDAWQMSRATTTTPRAAVATLDPPERQTRWSGTTLTLAACGAALVILGAGGLAVMARRHASPAASASSGAALRQRPLANEAEIETMPSLSPDGQQVVYFWGLKGAAGLFVRPTAGGAATPLALGDRRLTQPAYPKWSPRGDLIAFLSLEHEDIRGLYVVAPTGGAPRRLTAIAGIGLCWSPDGRALAFVDRNASAEPLSIFSLTIGSGERRRLTTPPAGSFGDTHCAFSPDARQLAVSRYHTRYQSDLYLVDLDGNADVRPLTHDFEGIEGLDWSADGRDIVFGTYSGLWRIRPAAPAQSSPELITAFGDSAAFPTFSRAAHGTESRLAYQRKTMDLNLWRWDRKSPDTVTKITTSTGWEDHPALSRDGRRLAFVSNQTGAPEIWVANADGSAPKQVTFHRGPIANSPRWSPDGRRLAYSAAIAGNRDIFVVTPDGSGSVRLTWEPSQEEYPSWSRDGRAIYFRSDRTGVGQIWKVALDGGAATRVTRGEALQAFESPDGRLLYFVRSVDVPGLWSTPVGGGEETFVAADVREALWDVADSGIAFVASGTEATLGRNILRFFDFASRTTSTLATLPARAATGFAVAPDARSVLWTRIDSSQSDLFLIDPWNP
jgi:Tol biopolymer transport system component